MTRDDVLTLYRPIRAGIQRVLRLAGEVVGKADIARAIKQVAPWADQDLLDQAGLADMVVDVALFEQNLRGRRAFDKILAEKGDRLDAADQALAKHMARAWFSIFRVAGRHKVAGMWLEDLLAGDRRLWLVDKALEASAPEGAVIGMRLFDAGPFHAGFGLIVQPDEETVAMCRQTIGCGGPVPFRQSLAATLYGDQLREQAEPEQAFPDLMQALAEMLEQTAVTGAATTKGKTSRPRTRARRRAG